MVRWFSVVVVVSLLLLACQGIEYAESSEYFCSLGDYCFDCISMGCIWQENGFFSNCNYTSSTPASGFNVYQQSECPAIHTISAVLKLTGTMFTSDNLIFENVLRLNISTLTNVFPYHWIVKLHSVQKSNTEDLSIFNKEFWEKNVPVVHKALATVEARISVTDGNARKAMDDLRLSVISGTLLAGMTPVSLSVYDSLPDDNLMSLLQYVFTVLTFTVILFIILVVLVAIGVAMGIKAALKRMKSSGEKKLFEMDIA